MHQNVRGGLPSLQDLQRLFAQEDISALECLPLDEVCKNQLQILDKSNDPPMIELASDNLLALFKLDYQKPSDQNIVYVIQVLRRRMINEITVRTSENCIHIIRQFVASDPIKIGRLVALKTLIKGTKRLPYHVQETALDIAAMITKDSVKEEDLTQLHRLLKLVTTENVEIATKAAKIANDIIIKLPPKLTPKESVQKICQVLSTSEDTDVILSFISSLSFLATSSKHTIVIVQAGIDYERLLFCPKIYNHIPSFQKEILRLFKVLMPIGKMPQPFSYEHPSRRPPESRVFIESIQGLLTRLIVERPLDIPTLLQIFAVSLKKEETVLTEKLVVALVNFSEVSDYAPSVLFVISLLNNIDLFKGTAIFDNLQQANVDETTKSWYKRTLNTVIKRQDTITRYHPSSLSEIYEIVASKRISPLAFLTTGALHSTLELLNQVEELPKPEDALPLLDLAFELLDTLSFAPMNTNCDFRIFTDNLRKKLAVLVNKPRTTVHIGYTQTFLQLEQLINNDSYDTNKLQMSMGNYSDLMPPRPFLAVGPQEIAAHFRAFIPGEYPRMRFFSGNKIYSSQTSVFEVVCDQFNAKDAFKLSLNVDVLMGDMHPSPPKLTSSHLGLFADVLELIDYLQYLDPSRSSETFSEKVHHQLSSPLDSIGRFSPAIYICFKYPRLVHFKTRLLAFKAVALEPLLALRALAREFNPPFLNETGRPKEITLVVSRNYLFHQGLVVLDSYAQNRINIDVTFQNEDRSATGSIKKFFVLMGREFMDPERDLFFTEKGLFPKFTTDTKIFYLLGVLVAKAIAQNTMIDMNFAPGFFDLLSGKDILIEDVSPTLASELQNPAGLYGRPFTLPYGCQIPLIQGGEKIIVDQSNVSDYIRCVESLTCGEGFLQVADAFRDGFSTNIHWNLMEIFTTDEVVSIIKGEDPQFTEENLQKAFVKKDAVSSREFETLISALAELPLEEQKSFLLMVTGQSTLPIGGLDALEPAIQIDRVVGSSEIMAVALDHVLKLPAFQEEESLREAIQLFMRNCK